MNPSAPVSFTACSSGRMDAPQSPFADLFDMRVVISERECVGFHRVVFSPKARRRLAET